MAKRLRKGEFLLVRNSAAQGWYYVYPAPAVLKHDQWALNWESDTDKVDLFCPSVWHRAMPKSLHLKPGGGPIRIRVEAVK